MLAVITNRLRLEAVTLPGACADVSRAHLRQAAALARAAETAGLTAKVVKWSVGGACCLVAHGEGSGDSLFVQQPHSAVPFAFRGSGEPWSRHVCVSPSGRSVIFTAAREYGETQRVWLLEQMRPADAQMRSTRLYQFSNELDLDCCRIAWHPSERYVAFLTLFQIQVCARSGVGNITIDLKAAAGGSWACGNGFLSFTPCGSQLHALLDRNMALVVTLADDPALQHSATLQLWQLRGRLPGTAAVAVLAGASRRRTIHVQGHCIFCFLWRSLQGWQLPLQKAAADRDETDQRLIYSSRARERNVAVSMVARSHANSLQDTAISGTYSTHQQDIHVCRWASLCHIMHRCKLLSLLHQAAGTAPHVVSAVHKSSRSVHPGLL